MKRILLAIGILFFMSAPSWAVCAVTNLQVKDNAAVTAAVPYADDGSGASNCSPQIQIKQGGNVANVNASHQLLTIDANSAAILSALGAPFQAGGSIANTGFNALQGGSANAVGNPFFVSPGTGASFTVANGGTFAVQAAQSGTWNVTNISGTVSLPTGAATAANQSTEITSLATIASNTGAAVPAGTNLIGNFGQVYPAGSTPITASATGTTASTTATLAASVSLHTYICGFSIRANATAAATGNATVTGMVTGTTNWTQWTAPNASGLGVTEEVFSPCIISSAVNTGIAVISAAPGTGGVVSVSAWGYQL